jgi:hypothetical protein
LGPPQLEHAPAVHTPWFPPHIAAAATQDVPAQHPSVPHEEFAQHGWPVPPHATNAPPVQTVPASVLSPAGMQVPLAASRHAPPLHVVPPHAGWNASPHGEHVPAAQTAFAPHIVPPQHGWPSPPQPAHCPDERHTSPAGQVLPVPMQVRPSQQPAPQVSPAQHAWPSPPHASHRPLPPLQAVPAPH